MQFEALGFRNVNDLCQQVCAAADSASSVKTNGGSDLSVYQICDFGQLT